MGTFLMLIQTKTKTRKIWMNTTSMRIAFKSTEQPTIYSVQNLVKLQANSSEIKYCLMLFDWDRLSITTPPKLKSNSRISLKLKKIRDWRGWRVRFRLLWVSTMIRKCTSKLRIYDQSKVSKNHLTNNISKAVIWRFMQKQSWILLFTKNYVRTVKKKIRRLS